MSDFVIDCSVTMSWCFDDEADEYSDRVLDALNNGNAHAPGLWLLETANVLAIAERRGRLTEADSANFVELLKALSITIDEEVSPAITLLAHCRAYGLTAYDAVYLDLAMRNGIPLATRDDSLRSACRKSGVTLFKT